MPEQHTVEVSAPITVTVDIEKIIAASGYLPSRYDDDEGWEPTGLECLVANLIATKLAPEMRDTVRSVVREVALGKIDSIVAEVMEGQISLTNGFGERTGKSTTLREQMVKAVRDRLDRKVTRNGNDVSGYDRDGMSYTQCVATEYAKSALNGELKQAAADAVAEVKDSVKKIVADDLAARVTQAVTRSL